MKNFMSKKLFDILRIAQIVIPALAACYGALAKIWGWGYDVQVIATASAIVALLGVILKIDSHYYFAEAEDAEEN